MPLALPLSARRLFAGGAALGLCMLAAGAAAAETPTVQQLQCRGFEPFFAITAGPDAATWSEPGKEMTLRGGFKPLDFLQPPWLVWRGVDAKARRSAPAVVVTARQEACVPSMGEGDKIAALDWRAVVSHPDGRVMTGCCTLKTGIDLSRAPVARAAAKPSEDWSRHLGELLPAINVCLVDGVPSTERVSKAWPMNHGKAGVRLVDREGVAYDCVADLGLRKVETVERVALGDTLPGDGDPVFWPAREQPPSIPCGRAERVLDRQGRTVGYLNYQAC
ncbi:hypothetical protein [Rivibacter subsaxonicus]|uniref:Uncharacterized protein n=1 Tax=Rivibacter subsaxonicus TaxID=457575 RepID=A0A4Q7VZM0_9BURK|nr:hypothetical protein [Rivibacter subsaxonicus]RZU02008.1 hypothetical protein EV670_0026 [Rivibacter subsaxonicus]